MKRLIWTIILAGAVVAQNSGPIQSQVTTIIRSETRMFDLHSCDTLHISGPLIKLTVEQGEFDAYWFPKYMDLDKVSISCTINVK